MNTPAPSPKLTPDQMHAVLTDWHAHYCDDPLYSYMQHSFEDMADMLARADHCVKTDEIERDRAEQEDMPGFGGTYAQLSALTLRVTS